MPNKGPDGETALHVFADLKTAQPKKEKKAEPSDAVPLYQLFAYADPFDYLLMATGTVGAIAHGAALPVFFLFFGKLLNGFGANSNDPNQAAQVVAKVLQFQNPKQHAYGFCISKTKPRIPSGEQSLRAACVQARLGFFHGSFSFSFLKSNCFLIKWQHGCCWTVCVGLPLLGPCGVDRILGRYGCSVSTVSLKNYSSSQRQCISLSHTHTHKPIWLNCGTGSGFSILWEEGILGIVLC